MKLIIIDYETDEIITSMKVAKGTKLKFKADEIKKEEFDVKSETATVYVIRKRKLAI